MAGKQIPHSLESESCLLGAMIFDNQIIPKVLPKISGDSFFIDSYRAIYQGILKTYTEKKAVDLVLLKDNMDKEVLKQAGGVEKLMAVLEGLPNAANWEAYLATVKEKEELRRYLRVAEQTATDIYAGTIGKSDLRARFQTVFSDDQVQGLADHIGMAGESVRDSMARTRTGGIDLSTGLRDVDQALGGLRRKEMTVCGAKMSNGKTSVAINILANAIAENKRVLINAFENPDQVPMRLASILYQIPLEHFVKPHLATEAQYTEASAVLKGLENFKDLVLVMNSASVLDMRGVCNAFKPDIIIVDYLQKYGQRYCTGKEGLYAHEIGRVASEVQDLAKDFNAHSLLFSQLARRMNGERNRPPEVPDLKESGDIENCADNILLLWWPWRDNPEGGKDPSDYYVIIGKNKLGPCEKKILRIDLPTLTIKSYGG